MFDGSHRSRRAINLGGNGSTASRRRTRSRTSSSRPSSAPSSSPLSLQRSTVAAGIHDYKSQVLQSTLQQRQERRKLHLQNQSVTCIQRIYRGFVCRRRVALQLTAAAAHCSSNSTVTTTTCISMRLSPPLKPFLPVPVRQVLLDYQAYLATHPTSQTELTGSIVAVHRLLPITCQQIRDIMMDTTSTSDNNNNNNDDDDRMEQLLRTLVQHATTASTATAIKTKGFFVVDEFIAIITLCQDLLWKNPCHYNQKNKRRQEKQQEDLIVFLWQRACSAATSMVPHNNNSSTFQDCTGAVVALLAVTFFGHNCNAAVDNVLRHHCHHPWTPTVLLIGLVHCITTTTTTNDTEYNNRPKHVQLLYNTFKRCLQGREGNVLVNAIRLLEDEGSSSSSSSPQLVLPLMQYVLSSSSSSTTSMTQQQQPLLQTLAAMVATEGEAAVRNLVFQTSSSSTAAAAMQIDRAGGGDDNSSDSDDDDDDDYRHVRAPSVPAATQRHKSSSSSRLTREQLQTTSKLDRLHQEYVQSQQRQVLQQLQHMEPSVVSSMLELAIQISNPTLWIQWGTTVLLNSQDEAMRHCYIAVLSQLLTPCTGLRTTTTATGSSSTSTSRTAAASPLLSQLAFSNDFLLQALWRNVLVLVVNNASDSLRQDEQDKNAQILAMNTTLFCNVFTHHLIALSDDEFLAKYTTMHGSQVILAEHVIVHLRTVLHDLYWNKPVLAQDLSHSSLSNYDDLKAHRARLMLAGTKLWNSLYERWCRLVRIAPFCDESTWWFPRLVSRRDDHAAVIDVRHDGQRRQDHDENGMDENDDDDDDSVISMEVDHPPSEAELQTDALADSFHDPKMARILTCIPQALPFERRVKLFSSLLAADKLKTQDETAEFHNAVRRMMEQGREMDDSIALGGREHVEIRRDALYGDSKQQLSRLGNRLKHKVQVTFINRHGAPEAGIDGGGVFKEFLDDLISEAFDPSQHKTGAPTLFSVTPSETLAANMATAQSQEALPHYEFLGRVLGKAVYESILVEPQFCLPFLNQLLGKQNSLEDLKNLDREYYSNLIKLRTLSAAEINDLGMSFELTLDSGDGTTRTVELLPGSSSLQVTKDNVIQYVHLVAHQRLNVQAARPTRAFLRGFRDLIPASWVRLFSSYELQKMISGDDTVRGIDVSGLKAAMQYAGGYHPSQPTVQWFWEVVEEMTPDQQRKLLRFMTSCSRQPLLGFQSLAPAPCIQQIRLPDDLFRGGAVEAAKTMPLPTSATCMNLLKLPNYRSKELLRDKLIASIESGAGFELT